jgi:hypothetical protein
MPVIVNANFHLFSSWHEIATNFSGSAANYKLRRKGIENFGVELLQMRFAKESSFKRIA